MVDSLPPHSLGPSDPWARAIESLAQNAAQQVASLESRFTAANQSNAAALAALWGQISQLNNAGATARTEIYATQFSSPNSTSARTNADLALVSFTVPTWATRATVIATATFSGYDSPNAGFTATVSCVIGETPYGATNVQVPNVLPIYLGGSLQSSQAFDTAPAPTTITAADTISVSEGTLTAAARITKPASGGTSSFAMSIAASVFWSAP